MRTTLRFICRLIVFVMALILVLPWVVVGILLAKICHWRSLNEWLLTRWSRLLLGIFGLSISIHGRLPDHPVFIVANHVSWLDIPVIHSFTQAGFVGKKEIKYWPILGWLAMLGDTIFIQRGNQNSRKQVLESLKKRLSQGRSVAVFPEGRVTDGSQLGRFHRQLLKAAADTGTPVVPIAIKFITAEGTRNDQIGFINNEWFIVHVCRLLTLPSSHVEIHCGHGLSCEVGNTRLTTAQAREFVAHKLTENDYLPRAHTA